MEQVIKKTQRVLRLEEVKAITGLSRSTIYAWMKAGQFPCTVTLGNRLVGWMESEIAHWIGSRTTSANITPITDRE